MKGKVSLLLAVFACFALFSACKGGDTGNAPSPIDSSSASIEKEKLEINKTAVTLKIGDTTVVAPTKTTDKTVEYFSGNESVATVNENGEVVAVGVGVANIFVTVGDLTATCVVTVAENLMPAYSVHFSRGEYSLERGESYTLTPVVKSGETVIDDAVCAFSSSNEEVATVDETGKITAIKQGETIIRVAYGEGDASAYTDLLVTVIRPLRFEISNEDLDMSLASASQTLTAKVFDGATEITDAVFEWTSEDESIVQVDKATGAVLPVGAGEAKIYASFEKGRVECQVRVWTAFIEDEADFMQIYDNLDGYYKLANDLTLTQARKLYDPADPYYRCNFTGILNGGGYTLTTTGMRLFQTVSGRVENASIVCELGNWGGAIAYALDRTGVLENIDFDITFGALMSYRDTKEWIPDLASGVVTENNGLIKDCTAQITVKDDLSQTDAHNSTTSAHGYSYAVANLSAYAMLMTNGSIENCTAIANKEISFVYGAPSAGIVKSDKEGALILLDIDETYLVYAENATYESSDPTIVSVSDDGVITALAGGFATVRVETEYGATKYPVSVWKSIATEADFMQIYDNLGGHYKLANDLTLTQARKLYDPADPYYHCNFKGVIDGNGNTLTTTGMRLFQTVSGTIKNAKIVCELGNWGGAIGYDLTATGVLENIDFDITFGALMSYRDTKYWIPDLASGVVTENNGLIKDCTAQITVKENLPLTDAHGKSESAHGYPYGVESLSVYAMLMQNGSIENCTASGNQAIRLVYGVPEVGVAKAPVYADPIELFIGDTRSVAVQGARYESSDPTIARIDDDGVITALVGGVAVITVTTAEQTTIYTVGVWQTIATAEDWLKVYEKPDGYFKLTQNIDLSENWTEWRNYAFSKTQRVSFTGVIDGNDKKISGIKTRLFCEFNGTMKNIALEGDDGRSCWDGWFGGLLAIDMTGATVENLTGSVTLYHLASSNNSTDNYTRSAGGLSASINASTIKNSSIQVTIPADISSKNLYLAEQYPISKIHAWGNGSGNTFVNCTATSNNNTIQQLGTLNS